jgi:sulfhydrogenase subunit beta (sulfur reductase)
VEEVSVPAAAAAVYPGEDRGRLPGAATTPAGQGPAPRYAFLGARSCDLHAIEIQDRTFLYGPFVDPHYRACREGAFVIAVNCSTAARTCFCTSMQTGPGAERGFDLALTELAETFVVEVATPRGADLLAGLPCREATGEDLGAAARVVRDTAASITRRLETRDPPELLYNNLGHPRWDDVAKRCLSCTNCTMVCPTCFCHCLEEVPDLDGQRAGRVRLWDSCFNPAHGHMAGGLVRPDIRSRYRQWLTHKLASWIDQYGVSGCVGCGRCLTWCPVAIDLTEEVAAIRGSDDKATG